MQYRVYSGPKGSPQPEALVKDNLLFKEFALLDEALLWARHLGNTGRTPLLIEGDDGTHMTKIEIAEALRVGTRQSAG